MADMIAIGAMIVAISGVTAWIVTNLHIRHAVKTLSKRVVDASANTKQQAIDAVLGMEKRVETLVKGVETRFAAISVPEADEIASEVESALNAALGPFRDELASQVGSTVYQAVNQVKAQETKALQAQLEELGVTAVVDEAKGMLAESLPPQMIQAQRILSMKVSKRYSAEHPIEAQAIEMGKLYLMQMLQGQLGVQSPGARAERVSEARGSFGVR